MAISTIQEVVFGEDLPTFIPDTSLAIASQFAKLVGWGGPRFTDHEGARKEGLPGAMVPGILNQGYLVAMIHHWAQMLRSRRSIRCFERRLLPMKSTRSLASSLTSMKKMARWR